jgi:hypothetical protein
MRTRFRTRFRMIFGGWTVLLATVAAGLALLLVCLAVGLTVMLGHSYTLWSGFISGGVGV